VINLWFHLEEFALILVFVDYFELYIVLDIIL
jgi:hypothetical protein